jgi:ATP-dependent Zn protease
MTQANATQAGIHRPWWRTSRLWWLIAIAIVLGLAVGAVVEKAGRSAAMPYGAFLDQLEAGNVASVTFQGTEIDGRLKHPPAKEPSSSALQDERFSSRVPDFGDPSLIPELRKQHVTIDVKSPSGWTSLFEHLPWPMLAFVVLALGAALVRLMRGSRAGGASPASLHPGGGVIGLLAGLFAKKYGDEKAAAGESPGESGRRDADL